MMSKALTMSPLRGKTDKVSIIGSAIENAVI